MARKSRKTGGRDRDRTCDPYDVNEAAQTEKRAGSVAYASDHPRTSPVRRQNTSGSARKSRARRPARDSSEGEQDQFLSIYDGRDLVGTVAGVGDLWAAYDARGAAIGAQFKSCRAAIVALNSALPSSCFGDTSARRDNSV